MANLLSMATIDAIWALHQRHWSIRRIAKELGLHRDTVARHIHLHTQAAQAAQLVPGPADAAEGKIGLAPPDAAGGKLGQAPLGSDPPKLGQASLGSEAPRTRSEQVRKEQRLLLE